MRLPAVFSWLAAFSVVVALGAGAAVAAHDQSAHQTATVASHPSVYGSGSALLAADDPSPANHLHAPLAYIPPSPAAAPNPTAPNGSAPPRAQPAAPSIAIGSYQQVLINRDRASRGLRPLSWSSCLASVAAANAVRLSRQGWVQPYHTNGVYVDLGCHLGNRAGENVGYWSGGINDGQLNSMFMNSPEHYANIMGPYRYVGTAWAVAPNGSAYIAVEFS
jgi:uncharacterized protein YkwD